MKRKKCETLYDDFVTAAATYFCAKEEPLRALRRQREDEVSGE